MADKILVANWKMNGDKAFIQALCAGFFEALKSQKKDVGLSQPKMVLCPPACYLDYTLACLNQDEATCLSVKIDLGAQNCFDKPNGAYTGELSSGMLREFNCSYVIIGHSERRQYFGESDDFLAAKLNAAHGVGLMPILCVGEQQADREAGQGEAVVLSQLASALANYTGQKLVVAYEPVWAIGTGLAAKPEDAEAMHSSIRQWLQQNLPQCEEVAILYGGSVKADNAAALFAMPNIDGALVGGASLKPEFIEIYHALANAL